MGHNFLPVSQIQEILAKSGHSGILIRSTDRYFNEYVPKKESARALITGFDGSVGDALITLDAAHLFVDGRYSLQAKAQAPQFQTHVCQHNQSIESTWLSLLKEIFEPKMSLLYDPSTLDMRLFRALEKEAQSLPLKLSPQGQEIIAQFVPKTEPEWRLYQVSNDLTGATVEEKIQHISRDLKEFGIAASLVVKLDDIAWLLNMRSNRFPFQTSVPGIAAVMADKIILGLREGSSLEGLFPDCVQVVRENNFFQELKNLLSDQSIGIDEGETSKGHEMGLQSAKIPTKSIANPVGAKKAVKNEKELAHMREAFHKADQVVYQTHNYVVDCFEKGQILSEGQVDDYVKEQFFAQGACELSFRPICAGGKNGAVIHYGTPDHKTPVKTGDLFLLDTGAYYQGGYATDLTRTFLAAPKNYPAQSWQKEMFTLVLMASIQGLSARLRKGSVGMQLDAIVRQPLWQRGLDFAHGTGHGVGINVHEFPPRIGPSSNTVLLPHQVFSIEPGLYFEGLGGVRIENLATLVPDPEDERFLRVLPLTFCPFDERLIEENMLGSHEKAFLNYFHAQWQHGGWPELPPLNTKRFV